MFGLWARAGTEPSQNAVPMVATESMAMKFVFPEILDIVSPSCAVGAVQIEASGDRGKMIATVIT
jgi:hypothetical protein